MDSVTGSYTLTSLPESVVGTAYVVYCTVVYCYTILCVRGCYHYNIKCFKYLSISYRCGYMGCSGLHGQPRWNFGHYYGDNFLSMDGIPGKIQ